MKTGFYTLGCKLNQSETEALADAFRRAGHTAAGIGEAADLYILNTCTVTSKSEQKARRVVRKILAERRESPVILTGCYAEVEKDRLAAEFGPRVFVAGIREKSFLPDLAAFLSDQAADFTRTGAVAAFFSRISGTASGSGFRLAAARCSFHTRAFLKIQDGCDNRCAYCRVCIARGPSVSLDAEEVLRRFRGLETEGYREIVLTGVNLMAYSSQGIGLEGLLEKILAGEGGAPARLRISSLEPEGVTENLARVLSHPRVCPHFHLPLQSGSDSVLRTMARKYTRAMAKEAVKLLRAAKPEAFIAADIITGFPGETGEDHRQTESLAGELELASLHVFPFSRRPGTAAWSMINRVPERVRDERAACLRKFSSESRARYAARQTGRRLEVIIEKRNAATGDWEGLSENYMTVRGTESPAAKPPAAVPGAFLQVNIRNAGEGFLLGEILRF